MTSPARIPSSLRIAFSLVITIVLFAVFSVFRVNADYYQCGSPQCPYSSSKGEYCCQGGTMVCTGAGCPSWACTDNVYYKYPQTCNGSWTCCRVSNNCSSGCQSGVAYQRQGTCSRCPTISTGGDPPPPPPPPNSAPVCSSIYGLPSPQTLSPSYAGATNNIGYFNVNVSDSDGNQVRYNWGNSCGGSFPTISTINVRARGSSAAGGWPIMRIYKTPASPASVRTQACSDITVSNGSYPSNAATFNYSCAINQSVAAIDIAFPNDLYDSATGADRNLYIDRVELVTSGGARRIIEAEARTSGDNVIFDRGDSLDRWFDGLDINPNSILPQSAASGTLNGSEVGMHWGGSLRVGTLFQAPAAQPAGSSCTLTVSTSDGSASGSNCTKNITVCGIPPAVATPLYPTANASKVTVPVVFRWNAGSWGTLCPGFASNNTAVVKYKKPADTEWTTACSVTTATSCPSTSPISLEYGTTYQWLVERNNGQLSSSPATPWTFTTDFQQPEKGWFTAIGGDIYGTDIRVMGPAPLVNIGWDGGIIPVKLAYNNGSVFSGQSIEFTPSTRMIASDASAVRVSTNNLAPSGNSNWLDGLQDLTNTSINGDSNQKVAITDIAQFQSLDPSKVYVMDETMISKLEFAMDNCPSTPSGCTYNLTGSGVAVIYYLPGSGSTEEVNISSNFRHADAAVTDERILFVSNKNFIINQDIQTLNATKTSRANLEFGIVTSGTVTFSGGVISGGGAPASIENPIVAEGPIIANNITFKRVTQYNAYPGTIVRYNPLYISGLSSTAASSSNPLLFKSLFSSEIYWGESR